MSSSKDSLGLGAPLEVVHTLLHSVRIDTHCTGSQAGLSHPHGLVEEVEIGAETGVGAGSGAKSGVANKTETRTVAGADSGACADWCPPAANPS